MNVHLQDLPMCSGAGEAWCSQLGAQRDGMCRSWQGTHDALHMTQEIKTMRRIILVLAALGLTSGAALADHRGGEGGWRGNRQPVAQQHWNHGSNWSGGVHV